MRKTISIPEGLKSIRLALEAIVIDKFEGKVNLDVKYSGGTQNVLAEKYSQSHQGAWEDSLCGTAESDKLLRLKSERVNVENEKTITIVVSSSVAGSEGYLGLANVRIIAEEVSP